MESTIKALQQISNSSSITVSDFTNNFMPDALSSRQSRWLEMVISMLNDVKEKIEGFPESLITNEVFITTFLQTSQVAMRNHSKEKLENLRNIAVNCAISNPDESLRQLVLSLIDQIVPEHILVLKYPGYPPNKALPYCDENFRNFIRQDLISKGLIIEDNSNPLETETIVTVVGKELLRLIQNPNKDRTIEDLERVSYVARSGKRRK